MKKAFDENVSRAKPRVRLGTLEVADADAGGPPENVSAGGPSVGGPMDSSSAVGGPERRTGARPSHSETAETSSSTEPGAVALESAEAPALAAAVARRERLRARLKAARENPKPQPLPPTVAEAGVLAVERISGLQIDLAKFKELNLSLTQDLEAARRQAEKATEEARIRMDEAKRLASEMEARGGLLSDLERELASLEAERDEVLLSLQEARQTLEAMECQQAELKAELAKRDQALSESLSEEERLASELESARDDAGALRKSLESMSSERDTLARQVADLTKERAELLEARKALEAVHRALSQAVAR